MSDHELKIWPENFQAVIHLRKTYEIRKADRDFKVGDRVLLREWKPDTEKYTGNSAKVRITHLTPAGEWGLPADVCVFSVEVL